MKDFHLFRCLTLFLTLLRITAFDVKSFPRPRSQRTATVESLRKINGLLGGFFAGTVVSASVFKQGALAAVKASTLDEAKQAAKQVKKCIDGISAMEKAADSGDYAEVARVLSGPEYQSFESAATVLVRSDALTPDEKVALGTIKRYGVVADAIIMLGGLSGELKSGGFKIAGDSGPAAIETEEEDDDDDAAKPRVDSGEVRKYLKLSKDALRDIDKITGKILNL